MQSNQQYFYVYIGTYASSEQAGIHVLLLDGETGRMRRLHSVSGVANPSFLTIDEKHHRLFAVSETGQGAVVSYDLDVSNGTLRERSRQDTHGSSPCYVSVDESGRRLYTVNYMGGNVCLFSVNEDGTISPLADQVMHEGHGPNEGRQEAPHPHSITPIPGTHVQIVADLGTDSIMQYRTLEHEGRFEPVQQTQVKPGSGPRHVAFHPTKPLVYVVHELSSTVDVFERDAETGRLALQQSVDALPPDFDGFSTAADIHISPSGEYLYASNRGHDSITTYKVQDDGLLHLAGYDSVHGKTPRNFCLVPGGTFMLIANQDSDNLVLMEIGGDGRPQSAIENISIPKPVCVQLVPVDQTIARGLVGDGGLVGNE